VREGVRACRQFHPRAPHWPEETCGRPKANDHLKQHGEGGGTRRH
jgi:hypothetical protein